MAAPEPRESDATSPLHARHGRSLTRAWADARSAVSGPADTWRYLVPALAFGIGVTLFSLAIYLVLLGEWPWDWSIPRLATTLRSVGAQEQWAFGQLYTGFVGVFLAGALGFFAVKEFATNQESPRLELVFHSDDATLTRELVVRPDSIPGRFCFSVAIHNTGSVIARWYTLQLFLPFLVNYPAHLLTPFIVTLPDGAHMTTFPINQVVGRSESVKIGKLGSEWLLRFFSLGEDVCYPYDPLVLFTFNVPLSIFPASGRFNCRYHITTDRGRPVAGSLSLVLVTPNDSPPPVQAS